MVAHDRRGRVVVSRPSAIDLGCSSALALSRLGSGDECFPYDVGSESSERVSTIFDRWRRRDSARAGSNELRLFLCPERLVCLCFARIEVRKSLALSVDPIAAGMTMRWLCEGRVIVIKEIRVHGQLLSSRVLRV